MPRFKLLLALSISSILLTFNPSAAQKKISLGKVSEEELRMSVYEKDTAAGAVILSDVGKFSAFDFTFRRHIRIKILKKSGLHWGNWVFNTPQKSDFKVFVFNLVDGEIVKDKAEGASIFNEKIIDDFEVYKVFAPNVKVGSVIDIFYSHLGIPFEWRFQERIPVVYSDLVIEPTNRISYTKNSYGFVPIKTVGDWEWQATDVPAFKDEEFLNHYSNYITKFEIHITFVGSSYYFRPFSTEWRTVIDFLLGYENFGMVLIGSNFLNDYARELKAKPMSDQEKITEAFNYINSQIKWNGQSSAFTTDSYRKNFLENHSGNSAEVNLALVALLNKVGITAHPVVLSTRENGLLMEPVATIRKLNYVVAQVRHGDIDMLLDATSDEAVPGILPYRCLNGRGLMVIKNNEQWTTLHRNHKYQRKQFVNIDIRPDGSVKAKVDQTLAGYAFFHWMEESKGNDDIVEMRRARYQSQNSDLSILSYQASNDRKKYDARETIEIDMSNRLLDAGDGWLFNPFVLFEHTTNPFKDPERKFPVDFGYGKEWTTTILVQLPKEFSVKKMPESTRFTNPDKTAEFIYLASASDKGMTFKVVLKLNSPLYTESQYLELRNFFSEVAKIVNAPVELVKL